MRRPDLLRRVVVIGSNYHHDGLVRLTDFTPQSDGFAEFAVDFGARSPDGAAHAAAVVEKSLRLVKTEPTHALDELGNVSVPVLVIAGDDDVAHSLIRSPSTRHCPKRSWRSFRAPRTR